MSKLHDKSINDNTFAPKEGQSGLACSNKDSFHCPSSGVSSSVVSKNITVISVEEYRRIMNDRTSSEEQIVQRINYMEALCRNVIGSEIINYVERQK